MGKIEKKISYDFTCDLCRDEIDDKHPEPIKLNEDIEKYLCWKCKNIIYEDEKSSRDDT